jgi:hypothetical protein
VIIRAETYVSSGDDTTVVPRSRARANVSSDGTVPLLVTSNATPRSIARRCASGRSPITTTSPAAIRLGDPTSMDCAQTRPAISPSSPATSSPSSTPTTALTLVGASTRLDASRDSRM